MTCDTPGCGKPATQTVTSQSNLNGVGGYSLAYCDGCARWQQPRLQSVHWRTLDTGVVPPL